MDTTAIYMNYTKALEQAGTLSNVAKEVSSLASDEMETLVKNIKKDWTGTNSENYLGKMEALKKAIAASDVGAIPEMLSGGCGVTFPPRDADALKNALEELISDPEKRKTVSENAYKRLKENYTAEKVTAMLETVWRDVKKERKSYDG